MNVLICREVYHTKRMQHVICVKWSMDNKYILSGSDEMNIRLWKANAAEKLGTVSEACPCQQLYFPSACQEPRSPTCSCLMSSLHPRTRPWPRAHLGRVKSGRRCQERLLPNALMDADLG